MTACPTKFDQQDKLKKSQAWEGLGNSGKPFFSIIFSNSKLISYNQLSNRPALRHRETVIR